MPTACHSHIDGTVEGVPLVGTAAVELQDKHVRVSTKSMERGPFGWAVPVSIAPSRDIDVSAAVYGNALASLVTD